MSAQYTFHKENKDCGGSAIIAANVIKIQDMFRDAVLEDNQKQNNRFSLMEWAPALKLMETMSIPEIAERNDICISATAMYERRMKDNLPIIAHKRRPIKDSRATIKKEMKIVCGLMSMWAR